MARLRRYSLMEMVGTHPDMMHCWHTSGHDALVFCHAGFSRKTAASYLRATDGRPYNGAEWKCRRTRESFCDAENVLGRTHGFAPTHIITMHFAKRLCYSFFERGDAGNLQIKRPIRGLGQASRLHKTVVAIPFYNAAMQVIYKSNVRFADCPPRQRSRIAGTAVLFWLHNHVKLW